VSAGPVDIVLPSGQRLRYERLSYGVFDVTIGETEALPNAASPVYKFINEFRLIEQTDRIRATPGLVFGTSLVIASDDFGRTIPMTWVTRFPAGGIIAEDGTTFLLDRMSCDVPNGQVTFQSYAFDHAFELVPGEWHFELWCKERLIADSVFDVVVA
jgi:hypothetical protein